MCQAESETGDQGRVPSETSRSSMFAGRAQEDGGDRETGRRVGKGDAATGGQQPQQGRREDKLESRERDCGLREARGQGSPGLREGRLVDCDDRRVLSGRLES